uniref:Uncharacterized protein n=1 Tax=Anopheles atroparvus TaxID=41427 RepID=A0AAG5D3V1_ANOAO
GPLSTAHLTACFGKSGGKRNRPGVSIRELCLFHFCTAPDTQNTRSPPYSIFFLSHNTRASISKEMSN